MPATYDPERRYPLIYAAPPFESAAMARTRYGLDARFAENAIVVYPEKLVTTQAWDVSLTSPNYQLFDAIQAAVRSNYCIGKTYTFGYSDAGYYANALGCYRGGDDLVGVIAANGSFAGLSTNCIEPAVSAAILHAVDNPTVLFSNGEAARDLWKQKASCGVTSPGVPGIPACFSYEQCDSSLKVLWCPLNSGGHAYPAETVSAAAYLMGLP